MVDWPSFPLWTHAAYLPIASFSPSTASDASLILGWRAKALFGDEQALVPATRLVDGEFVTLEAAQEMTIFSLDFATPHILYVDGLELASNVDMRLDARAA